MRRRGPYTKLLLATTSVAGLLAGSTGAWACTVTVTGASSGFTNPSGTTIDCIDVTAANVTGNVVNAGTLSGAGAPMAGILVENGSIINGSVSNAGLITNSGGWGIANFTTITGGIRNSGTIASQNAGIGVGLNGTWVASFGGGIVNTGSISSAVLDGVNVYATTFNGGVSNGGSISGGRHGLAYIFTTAQTTSSPASTRPAQFSGGIANSGTITGSGGDAVRVTGGLFISAGFNTAEGTFAGGIANAGTLTGSQNGIYLYSFRTFAGGITNSVGGSITANGGDGIRVDNAASGTSDIAITNFSGGVTNAGSITASANGIRLLGINTLTGDVVNNGTITANGGAGILLATNGTAGSFFLTGAIRNGGTINASGDGISSNIENVQQGVVNTGHITGGDNGVRLLGLTLAGGISNGGTISGTNIGMQISTANSISGGFSNSGTVSGFIGVQVNNTLNFAGGIQNTGTIAGDAAGGLIVRQLQTFSGGITNAGTISSSGTALSITQNQTFNGNIVNTGTISGGTFAISSQNNLTGLNILQQGGLISGGIRLSTTQTDTLTVSGGTISGNITGGGTGIVNFAYGAGNSTTWSNTISGTGAINVNSGTVVLQGTWSSNAVTIASGATLAVGDGAAINSGITDNGTLAFQQTGAFSYGGVISGTGVVQQLGPGTTTLSGVNTYQGGSTVNGGVLAVSSDNNLGNAAGGLAFGGGTLRFLSAFTIARAITLNAGDGAFDTNGNTDTLGGAITGIGGLTKVGAGTLTLGGVSSYSGKTSVAAGTLQAGAANVFAPLSGFTIGAGAFLDLNNFNQTIGGLAGDGNVTLGTARLTTGGNGASSTFAGVIDGAGGIDKNGSGTFTLTGVNTYLGPTNINAGTLVVNGSLASSVNVIGGILMGNGTIGGLSVTGGTVAPGNSIGTLNVAGNVSFSPGSTYQVEVNGAGQGDRIIATGNAMLTGGTVQVLAQPGGYNNSTSYTILTANGGGGVTGQFAGVTSNFAFLAPSLSYPDGTNVILTMTRTTFTDPGGGGGGIGGGVNYNAVQVGSVLDTAPGTNPIVTALLGLTTAQAPVALNALSGEIHASVQSELLEDASLIRQTLLGRLRQAAYSSDATSNAMAALGYGGPELAYASAVAATKAPPWQRPSGADPAFWTQGFGAWGRMNGDGNAATVNTSTAGFMSGVDARLGDFWRAGIAGGATFSRMSTDVRGSANADAAHIAAYAGAQFGKFNARGGAAYSWDNINTSRTIAFPGFFDQTRAQYRASTAQVFGELGYGMNVGTVAIEPFGGLAYVRVNTGAFTETGGLAALGGLGASKDVTYSSLGARLASSVFLANGTVLIPRASVSWQHAFNSITPATSLFFQFQPASIMNIRGVPIARDSALVDAGFDWRFTPQVKLGITYTGEIAGQAWRHGVRGGFTWNF